MTTEPTQCSLAALFTNLVECSTACLQKAHADYERTCEEARQTCHQIQEAQAERLQRILNTMRPAAERFIREREHLHPLADEFQVHDAILMTDGIFLSWSIAGREKKDPEVVKWEDLLSFAFYTRFPLSLVGALHP